MKAGKEGPMKKNFPSAFKDNGDDDEAPYIIPTGEPGDRKAYHQLVDSIQKSIVPHMNTRFDDIGEGHLRHGLNEQRTTAKHLKQWVNDAVNKEAKDIYIWQRSKDKHNPKLKNK